MRFHYLPLPEEIAQPFLASGLRRVLATLNGHTLRRAIQGGAETEPFLLVGVGLLRRIGAASGDLVDIRLEPDPNPEEIELAEELVLALEIDEEAAARFYSFTPGRRRSLAHYVNSARRAETRLKRALELAEKIRTHTLHSDRNA